MVRRATRLPMPVTISCSRVPAHAAQSATVGSPASPGPNTVTVSPGSPPSGAQVDDRLVHRDQADHRQSSAAVLDLGPAGGGTRQPVGVAQRHQAEVGGGGHPVGMAVADGRAGPYPAYRDQRRGQRHRRPEAGRAARVDADQSGPDPAHGVVGPRVGQRRGGRGEVALRGAEPAGAGGLQGPREPATAEVVARVGGIVAAAEVTHQADHVELTPLLRAPGGATQPWPGGRRRAIAGHAGVDVQVDPGPPGRRGHGSEVLEPWYGDLDLAGERPRRSPRRPGSASSAPVRRSRRRGAATPRRAR